MSIKKTVLVTIEVDVTVDETTFTPEFLAEYAGAMSSMVETIDDHICNLARLHARGLLEYGDCEGYGRLADMGIEIVDAPFSESAEIVDTEDLEV